MHPLLKQLVAGLTCVTSIFGIWYFLLIARGSEIQIQIQIQNTCDTGQTVRRPSLSNRSSCCSCRRIAFENAFVNADGQWAREEAEEMHFQKTRESRVARTRSGCGCVARRRGSDGGGRRDPDPSVPADRMVRGGGRRGCRCRAGRASRRPARPRASQRGLLLTPPLPPPPPPRAPSQRHPGGARERKRVHIGGAWRPRVAGGGGDMRHVALDGARSLWMPPRVPSTSSAGPRRSRAACPRRCACVCTRAARARVCVCPLTRPPPPQVSVKHRVCANMAEKLKVTLRIYFV